MPQSSHQPDVRNEQQVRPPAPGHFPPGSSALDQGGHLEDIYARLQEIGFQVHQAVSSAPEIDRMIAETHKTPFTDRITRTRIPQVKLKIPTYEGGSDPKHFMTFFMTTIAKAHFSDEQRDIGCCQLFVEGFTGNALTWFSKLEANSIDNFNQLSTAFLKQYRVFIHPGASSSDLWSMTQKADETLSAYLGRFKEILSKVTISDEAAVAAFRKGLLQGSLLCKDLAIREPKDLDDVLHRAYRYAFLEDEDAKLAMKHHPAKAKEKTRETYQEPRQYYNPKAAKRGTIFAATNSEDRLPAPAKPSGSKTSYCGFHEFGGHSTEECKHLLNILLGKYKSDEDLQPPENHQPNQHREEEVRVPENELPGPPKRLRDGEDSVRALKKRARQACSVIAAPEDEQQSQDPITFTPQDAKRIQHPHNDAVVVELVMEDFDVERVLVDTGSSVNLLFLQTLDKMGISERKIKPKIRPLTGYDGEAKMSIGEIKLQVQAGGITKRTKFVVIDATPSYNAILGSPWIYSMRAIPSTYHLCLKFPIATGIFTRTCYVIEKKLNTVPTFKPVRQKRRRLGPDRTKAVQDEVTRLLKAGLIMEVQYPEWLANPVVVKKKNGKWRVCVDYTDSNKACPKDSYPLPHIDRLVEATAGNQLLSFMDAFSGYNKILMHKDDCEKTAFITDRGTYCYRVMPFGLKNAGATYQRLVNEMFAEQVGVTMEIYIDDMLVKSVQAGDHIQHLNEYFDILDKYRMKLNPTKCTFGVTSGEFLGYIVRERGIEANPRQINAILELPSPLNEREVQRLIGRIAALNRFIARSTDRCLPFYKILRGNNDFHWDEKCELAFQELKEYLTSGAILAKPEEGETLYLYVSVSGSAVSGVLVSHAGETGLNSHNSCSKASTIFPIAFRSGLYRPATSDCATHPKSIWANSEVGDRAQWAIELIEYDVEYRSRPSLKSQVLADFMTELSPDVIDDVPKENWILYADGSSSSQGSGLGILLQSPTREVLEQSLRIQFKASNNKTEYEALIAGLRLAKGIGAKRVKAFSDSYLVVSQFSGEFEAKNERMRGYLTLVQDLTKQFDNFELTKIPRSDNISTDALAALASNTDPGLRRSIPVENVAIPSIDLPPPICVIVDPPAAMEIDDEPNIEVDPEPTDWRDQIKLYIADGEVPVYRWEARRLKTKAANYVLHDGELYRRSATKALLTCVDAKEAAMIMEKTHDGGDGNHSGGRALALKIKKDGHYWPTMLADCEAYAAKCEPCQRHRPMKNVSPEMLSAVTAPYPFMRWAMDIVGPLPPSCSKKFLLVLTDYFIKWVEAEAYHEIKSPQVIPFIWKNIICRLGLPYEIVTDNETQFVSLITRRFLAKWNIRLSNSTPRYPQGNGQVEATNKIIIQGIKKRLGPKKGNWVAELDGVLWSYRTTPRRPSGQSPFSLAYGVEAMALSEAGTPTLQRCMMAEDPTLNNQLLRHHNDFAEELRDQALIRIQNYQNAAAKYYNQNVKERCFNVGDLVLREVFHNTKEKNAGKLGARWEGPYLISKVVHPGVYQLMTMGLKEIQNPWNAAHLKKYYY
ncbi:Integrase catalytic core [Arabidopsis suecica]|uniref:Integrase catalytic core n=1 Tax=Arabidopsis suecica TaxID=45249 RepID=A0A8T1YQC3_ARASU|nr:Integrase catalytic core [Arabidopsis suecica]